MRLAFCDGLINLGSDNYEFQNLDKTYLEE